MLLKTAPLCAPPRVQKNNRQTKSGPSSKHLGDPVIITRQIHSRHNRHVATADDVARFIRALPDQQNTIAGVERIILDAPNDTNSLGQYEERVVTLYPWTNDLCRLVEVSFYQQHREIFQALRVNSQPQNDSDQVVLWFNESSARAFLLTHVLLRQLGHHQDYLRSNFGTSWAGVQYAEQWANRMFRTIWPTYVRLFGRPEQSR